ncbi:MAG: hypothetical protein ACR2NR_04920 [Solirubrobacteraceae bacterium]
MRNLLDGPLKGQPVGIDKPGCSTAATTSTGSCFGSRRKSNPGSRPIESGPALEPRLSYRRSDRPNTFSFSHRRGHEWWTVLRRSQKTEPPRPSGLAAEPVKTVEDEIEPPCELGGHPDRGRAVTRGGREGGYTYGYGEGRPVTIAAAGGLIVLPVLLMILFRQKYPRWWFDWNLELMRFSARVGVLLALMDDRYPSTDDHQAVHLDFPYPDARNELNRWLPLVKWLLAIPHYVVLLFLYIAPVFVVIAACSRSCSPVASPPMFDFLVGIGRWTNRVIAYAHVLATDRYPPFRLAP